MYATCVASSVSNVNSLISRRVWLSEGLGSPGPTLVVVYTTHGEQSSQCPGNKIPVCARQAHIRDLEHICSHIHIHLGDSCSTARYASGTRWDGSEGMTTPR